MISPGRVKEELYYRGEREVNSLSRKQERELLDEIEDLLREENRKIRRIREEQRYMPPTAHYGAQPPFPPPDRMAHFALIEKISYEVFLKGPTFENICKSAYQGHPLYS